MVIEYAPAAKPAKKAKAPSRIVKGLQEAATGKVARQRTVTVKDGVAAPLAGNRKPLIAIRMDQALLDHFDAWCATNSTTRQEALRSAIRTMVQGEAK